MLCASALGCRSRFAGVSFPGGLVLGFSSAGGVMSEPPVPKERTAVAARSSNAPLPLPPPAECYDPIHPTFLDILRTRYV